MNNGNNNIHVVPFKNKWKVSRPNNTRATAITNTQHEGINIARKIAKKNGLELFIHGQNGKIRQKDSYGNDPKYIKG